MIRSRYDRDHGRVVVRSVAELLAALDVETIFALEAWANGLVEPYVAFDVDIEEELSVTLDGGFCAILDYPFSVEFLVETIEDLEQAQESEAAEEFRDR